MPNNQKKSRDRTRKITRTTVYDQEYFSSSQVNLYIGDVLIDECTQLSIQVQQNKIPIYGYASQLFDATAAGTVLVMGSFELNFKESGYLYTVLNRHKRLQSEQSAAYISPYVSNKNIGKRGSSNIRGASRGTDRGGLRRANIETIERAITAEATIAANNRQSGSTNVEKQLVREDLVQYYQELSGFNNPNGAIPFAENLFEDFEDRIWGQQALENDVRRADDNSFDQFTIYVTYGDFNSNNSVNHTARRIDGVRLTGQAQTIINNGEPIKEQYSFIARNWV